MKTFQTNIGISFDLDSIAAFKIHAKRVNFIVTTFLTSFVGSLALDLMGPGGELLDGAKVQFILPHNLFDCDIDMLPDFMTGHV